MGDYLKLAVLFVLDLQRLVVSIDSMTNGALSCPGYNFPPEFTIIVYLSR